jgi:ATP-dependent phosphoenolpyruvate carboxykinase
LHEQAHIDYDRVAIIPNPSVATLYEDALVYETGSAITSTGALTAYSGAKTGRSPLDKRMVKEPGSENDIWWGPVNKPMTPEVRRLFSFCLCVVSLTRDPPRFPSARHWSREQQEHCSIRRNCRRAG